MEDIAFISGAALGALAVILGAFGAHALKKTLSEPLLKSFETGVKYQMYHALALLVSGFILTFDSTAEKLVIWFFLIGSLLFSFSIYALSLTASMGRKIKFLGPVTPIGGLLLVLGWCTLVWVFIRQI